MNVATNMAEALVNATIKAGGTKSDKWIARAVADRALHTDLGIVSIPAVQVIASRRTQERIAREQLVDVTN